MGVQRKMIEKDGMSMHLLAITATFDTYSSGVAASRLKEESIFAHKVLISANVKSLAQQSGDSP